MNGYQVTVETGGDVAHVEFCGEPPIATFYRREREDPEQLARDFLEAKTLRTRLFHAEQHNQKVDELSRLIEQEPEAIPGRNVVQVVIAVIKRLKGL